MTAVFIDGAAGTTGIEIADRLRDRPEFDLILLSEDRRKDDAARSEAFAAADVAILCLPDDAARAAVAMTPARTKIIDASTAHRVAPGWVYGFPELTPDGGDAVRSARLVSNPGCYPTGFLALVRPLIDAGLVPRDWPLSVHAVSGYSGGGKAMIAEFEGGGAGTAHRAYALGLGHKHLAEMRAHAGLAHPPLFTPNVARTHRGMIVEVPLPLHALPARPRLADIRDVLTVAYRGSAIVRVPGEPPPLIEIERLAGRDGMELFAFGDEESGQARLIAVLDNLGKGASGAAVQNLNLMAGLDETVGLRL